MLASTLVARDEKATARPSSFDMIASTALGTNGAGAGAGAGTRAWYGYGYWNGTCIGDSHGAGAGIGIGGAGCGFGAGSAGSGCGGTGSGAGLGSAGTCNGFCSGVTGRGKGIRVLPTLLAGITLVAPAGSLEGIVWWVDFLLVPLHFLRPMLQRVNMFSKNGNEEG